MMSYKSMTRYFKTKKGAKKRAKALKKLGYKYRIIKLK
jgi:hypothetical protein